jgi:LVIVD repeat
LVQWRWYFLGWSGLSRYYHGEFHFVKRIIRLAVGLILFCPVCLFLSGCGAAPASIPQVVTSVTPSSTGIPNSVASLGNYEFVSVQGTGQIFTYDISTGSQVAVGAPYITPCIDPSGMLITSIAGNNIMAVVCYDTGSLLTLSIGATGSLTPLGSVSGLAAPYPGAALDGTNVLVPLFGQSATANGGVARVSIASPANPVITGTAMLTSPAAGEFANPGYLVVSSGYIYLAAGSESAPQGTSSTIQVVDEASMTLVGTPLTVAHSPQQIAVEGSAIYVTFFDATQLESIDISNPASLQPLQIASLAQANTNCHGLPIAIRNSTAYVGCYYEDTIEVIDITTPSNMKLTQTLANIAAPQRLAVVQNYLLATSSSTGGSVYQIPLSVTSIGGTINTP